MAQHESHQCVYDLACLVIAGRSLGRGLGLRLGLGLVHLDMELSSFLDLNCNLRHGFEAAHPENSRRPHNVPTTTQVHRGALAGSRGGRTQRVIRKHTLRVIV